MNHDNKMLRTFYFSLYSALYLFFSIYKPRMSAKLISLDIQAIAPTTLDITEFFPLSDAHAIGHGRFAHRVDDWHEDRGEIDLSSVARVSVERFYTIGTLDIAHIELRQTAYWQKKLLDLPEYPRIISLIDPLSPPYGAIDVRSEPIRSHRRYADLFERKLPYTLMTRRALKMTRWYIRSHRRAIAWGILTACFVLFPTLYTIKYSVESGYQELLALSGVQTIEEARERILDARGYFERANFLAIPFLWIPWEKIGLLESALRGGLFLSRGLDETIHLFPDTPVGSGISIDRMQESGPMYRGLARDYFFWEKYGIDSPTDWLEEKNDDIVSIARILRTASEFYSSAPWDSEYAKKMHSIWWGIKKFLQGLDTYSAHQAGFLRLLGHEDPERYVIFNQNRDELRANGGFPGTILSFTLYKGNILDYRKDDVYYYDWNLYPYKEIPPPGIALLTTNFGLRDVNYYPDFRQTLEKANEFIERSGDATITSGIAIHQWLIEDMLGVIGPVTLSGIAESFDQKNFSLLMSTLVEAEYNRDLHPKGILFEFIEAFVTQSIQSGKYDELLSIVEKYWKNGEILFASRDRENDEFIANFRKKLPWETENPNWIYPVTTSVSGNKSDRYIDRSYNLAVQPVTDCLSEYLLTVTHTHTFDQKEHDLISRYFEAFDIDENEAGKKMRFIQGEGKNRSYVRVYVPLGARLAFTWGSISSTQNEYATVFSFTLDTDVGQSSTKTLRYALDLPECQKKDTTVHFFEQPGLRDVRFTLESR